MYGSHHQQPQNQGRNDEPDPFLVVEEPSMMHGLHGQHSYRPDPTEHVITSTGRCTWPAPKTRQQVGGDDFGRRLSQEEARRLLARFGTASPSIPLRKST